jgi:hypothetical protein
VRKAPDTLISSLIETRHGRRIARIRQDIDAMAVPKVLAEELKVDAGSPALKVVLLLMDTRLVTRRS